MAGCLGRAGQGCVEATDLVDAQRDEWFRSTAIADRQRVGGGVRPGVGGGDGEPGVGEHGEGDVAVPSVPEADLVVVEADLVLARLEALLDRPADADDGDQAGERSRGWGVAE